MRFKVRTAYIQKARSLNQFYLHTLFTSTSYIFLLLTINWQVGRSSPVWSVCLWEPGEYRCHSAVAVTELNLYVLVPSCYLLRCVPAEGPSQSHICSDILPEHPDMHLSCQWSTSSYLCDSDIAQRERPCPQTPAPVLGRHRMSAGWGQPPLLEQHTRWPGCRAPSGGCWLTTLVKHISPCQHLPEPLIHSAKWQNDGSHKSRSRGYYQDRGGCSQACPTLVAHQA